jgi:hypothetical protein
MKKNHIQTYLLTVVTTLLLTGCDQLVSYFATPDDIDIASNIKSEHKSAMEVHQVNFSPDYKTFSVITRLYRDIGPYSLTDSTQVRAEVQCKNSGIIEGPKAQPRLKKIINTKAANVVKKDVQVLALIDLTQPQEVLDRIKSHLIELSAVFNDSNMFIAFAYGDSISRTIPATAYTLNRYLVKAHGEHVLLYRGIIQKYDEMVSHQGPWANAKRMALLIISDSQVYDNTKNMPIDPDHYTYEEAMTQRGNYPDPNMIVCYASMHPLQQEVNSQDILALKHFCTMSNGIYMHPYNGTDFKNSILDAFSISPDANEFVFENPNGKVFRGSFETLTVNLYSIKEDTLITSFSTNIHLGDFYNPIIVHGMARPVVVLLGVFIAAIIAFIVWMILQYLVPFIRYKLFYRKYVIRYSGHNMGIGANVVAESCYLCKEPFEIDDEIVVKCSHTMHKQCWDENGYHCTEYSDRCKDGSHYYNAKNISDRHNAPFYTKWVLAGIIAITLAWTQFIFRSHRITVWIVTKLSLLLTGIEDGSPEAELLFSDNHVSPLSSFGFSNGLMMTLAVALLSTKWINIRHNMLSYVTRSLVAAILCYMTFMLTNILIIVSDMGSYAFIVEWIPWVISSLIIAYCGTHGTRVVLQKRLIIPCIFITIVLMYLWWLFYGYFIDYRIMLLLAFLLYGCGLMICIATVAPHSERFFLRVEGAVKEMDVAIYKWFRNAPDGIVTIGKSVDCSLQLSWDVSGFVAPTHAEIRMRYDNPYLKALEEGVFFNGKPLDVGKEVWLYHNASFSIANTTFTYIEKDLA